MLSVAVHKDIGEYKPKIIGKMTARTLVGIGGAIGSAVATALYMYFVLGLNVSDHTIVIYIVSLPFWCIGFIQPKGIPFEKFAPLWIRNKLIDDRIMYTPTMIQAGITPNTQKGKPRIYGKYYTKQCKLKGIEAYSPRQGKVI